VEPPTGDKDIYQKDAYEKIERLLLYPVLYRVFHGPKKFSLTGTILARLNRAELGDRVCFILANFLISQFRGTVIIPDFGFYAHKGHANLIRQNRLIAGINSFAEVPDLEPLLLQIKQKVGHRTTAKDAETLAGYCGFPRGTNGYASYLETCLS
jgi:hypothetical protein